MVFSYEQKLPLLYDSDQRLLRFIGKGDKERILEAGCDAYVSKPIDTRKLPLVIADVLKDSEKT